MRSTAVCAVLALVIAGGAAVAQPVGGGPPPQLVVLDAVRAQPVERWRDVTGELRAVRRSVVASEAEGAVVELGVDAGDAVRAGDVLARLDDRLARFDLDHARATVASRRATAAERSAALEKARRDHERRAAAARSGAATETEVLDARSAADAAQARLAEAEADAAEAEAMAGRAEKKLADMAVRAPFDGVVVSKRSEVGQWVTPGAAVAEVVSIDQLDVWLDVPEAVAMHLAARLARAAGTPGGDRPAASVRVGSLGPAAEPRTAPILAVSPAADPLSRLFPVRVRLDNADRSLRPGMSVVGRVPGGETETGLTVHKDAVKRGEAGAYVFMDAGGVAAIAPVTVVYALGDRVVVTSPALKEGVRVVTEGNERVFPGQPLTAKP